MTTGASCTVEGTVATATVAPALSQCLFLWEETGAPATTTASGSGYDPAGFRPTVTSVPAAGDTARGAVLLCAGGAFALRGDNSDCDPTAAELSARGYHCFVVDYRVRPYTQAEAGVDLARAIRFVRAHADDYGPPNPQHIALGGYSAGGILCGETILNWSGSASPAELDADYTPDALDSVSADAAATAMIYSFYGRLSVAEFAPDRLTGVVPSYYCYGTRDPFYDQFEEQVEVMAARAPRSTPACSTAGPTASAPRAAGSRSTTTSCSRPSRPPDCRHPRTVGGPGLSAGGIHQPDDLHLHLPPVWRVLGLEAPRRADRVEPLYSECTAGDQTAQT
ncbi:alpha/beta hydrolase [Actinomyces sp.]|uniref:alpha/beta hydrolase n=1 Tax=Actinomyces sp. TaxID=29317 RepID=UPI0026DA89A3|nr:alpha/beta hydrolase [Actinomyces sp.]MDO4900224.1 alpha/beta hydrolase [Actinomyces sp.]